MVKHKNKKGVAKKATPEAIKQKDNIFSEDEIIIGIPINQNKKAMVEKKKNTPIVKKKKVKKLSKKQIQRRKVILKTVKWTSLFAIICGIIIYIMLSPIFAIKTITVNTDGKLTEQEIINLSSINLNENTFRFTKKQIEENIKENSYVDEVIIKRKLPDAIEITIKERVPKFIITYGNAYVYISNQGYMLEITKEFQEFPVLKGIQTTSEDIEVGKRLCNEDLQKLTNVLKIMEVAKTEKLDELISEIDISNPSNYKITLDKEEKIVYLGDCSSLDQRILWVKVMLQRESGKAGEIFVNMNLNLGNPFFRERV